MPAETYFEGAARNFTVWRAPDSAFTGALAGKLLARAALEGTPRRGNISDLLADPFIAVAQIRSLILERG